MADSAPLPPPSVTAVPTLRASALLTKSILLILIAVVIGLLCKYTPLKAYLEPTGLLAEWFRGLGPLGVVVFTLSSAALILLGVPRIALCFLAGALYGFWVGLTLSTASTMISYYGAFLWIRGRRRSGIDATTLPKQLAFLSGDPGFSGVAMGRLLPAPGMLITLGLSLSSVSHRAYLAGSAVGSLPVAVFFVLAGALQRDFRKWCQLTTIGLFCLIACWILIRHLNRRAKALNLAPK